MQYRWVLAVCKKASSQFILISSVKVTVKFKQNILAGGMKLVGVLKLSKLRGTKKIIWNLTVYVYLKRVCET